MTPIRPGIRAWFHLALWRRRDAERDLRDEMELHVTLRARQLESDGFTPREAELEARRLFALNDDTINRLEQAALERNRHMRLGERWDAVWQDLRYSGRRLRSEPGVTAFLILTLALGIGVNVSAFSIVDRVLLRGPQHVREPDQLVRLYSRTDNPDLGDRVMPWLPWSVQTALGDGLRTIEAIGAYRTEDLMVGTGAESRMRRVSRASSEFFNVLGVRPQAGRFYRPDENADAVAVISEQFWRTELGGSLNEIGRSITIDGDAHTIVGVAPAGFTGAQLGRVDAWITVKPSQRNSMNVHLVARLRPGATVEGAVAEVASRRQGIEATLPSWARWLRGAEFLAAPIHHDDSARESFESVMARWLTVISIMILLISCANAANVLLARIARRQRELAVRQALGSGRMGIVRLLAAEGLWLSVGAAVTAFGIFLLVEPIMKEALFPGGSWTRNLVDPRMLLAVAGLTLLTAAIVSVGPGLRAGRWDAAMALQSNVRAGDDRSVLRPALTVVQALLCVVLLVGAGAFARSIQRVNAIDLGFEPDRVVTVEVRYPDEPRAAGESSDAWWARRVVRERERHQALADVARRLSDVEHAAVSVTVPLRGGVTTSVFVPGRDSVPTLPGGGPWVSAVSEGYFATLSTPIRRGRAFDDRDGAQSEPVVIVSESTARAIWPGRVAVGECLHIASRTAPCARVVGVASDIHRHGLREQPSMQLYVPVGQERGFSGSWLVVRSRGPIGPEWPTLKRALRDADPSVLGFDVRPMAAGLDGDWRPYRLGIVAFGISAALAVIVAGLGLYSIMSHAVAWRRREIGVRMALGAQRASVVAMVLGRGALLASTGMVLGILVALGGRRWLQPHLYETSVLDPVVLGGVIALLQLVSLLAGWVPVRRALAVSPAEALRAD